MSVKIEEDFEGFDWDSTDDKPRFEPVPPGWYPVSIEKAEVKTVTTGEGDFQKLALTLQVTEGEHKGRRIFDDLLLNNKEGNRKRRALVWHRLGLVKKGEKHATISENDLVGRQCRVEVGIREYTRKDGTPGRANKVSFNGYMPLVDMEGLRAGATASGGEATGVSDTLDETRCPF
jgi:hypothetical protein